MKRALALVVAMGMVAGALYVRSNVIDSDDPDATADAGDRPGRRDPDTRAVLACVPELVAVCDALAGAGVTVASDPVDLTEAAEPGGNFGVWLTYGPAPGMVNAAAGRPAFGSGTVVARARLGLVTISARAEALRRRCAVPRLTWKCLVDTAGTAWPPVAPATTPEFAGTVGIGVGQPQTALGATLLGPAALATADVADPGIDELDVAGVRRLAASAGPAATEDQLSTISTIGVAAFNGVVAPERAAERAAGAVQARGRGVAVLYPEPVAETVVVLSARADEEVPEALVDAARTGEARDALESAGWTPAERGATSGLPAPDVLYAIQVELR